MLFRSKMALFEGYERRIDQINAVLNSYGISSIEEAEKITKDAGLDVYDQVKKIQPICFENACWAYTVGAAIAIKKGCTRAADAAAAIGEGLQAFCIPGSVADHRKVGLGHGNLGKMLVFQWLPTMTSRPLRFIWWMLVCSAVWRNWHLRLSEKATACLPSSRGH